MKSSEFQTVFKPIPHEKMQDMAGYILRQVKLLCPRFSMPKDPDDRRILTELWTKALENGPVFHPASYSRAVELYAVSASHEDNPPMPGDILRLCRAAVERMEQDPVEGPKLELWRQSRNEYLTTRRNHGL